MAENTYTVTGMSCDHCARAVTAELAKVPGVVGVDVELPTGAVRVSGDEALDSAAVRAAVNAAGYEVAP
jgi:copper chaperone